MKRILLSVFAVLALGLFANAQNTLFFSEYVEGSKFNKAIEVYNPTNETIDLSEYSIMRFNNGSGIPLEAARTTLTGTIAPYSTFILVSAETGEDGCDPALQALGNQQDGTYPKPTYMNGNDALVLYKGAEIIDIFGKVGEPRMATAAGWINVTGEITYTTSSGATASTTIEDYIVPEDGPFWLAWSENHSLVRKSSVKKGVTINPEVFNIGLEWDTVPGGVEAWRTSGTLGKHDFDDAPASINDNKEEKTVAIYPNPVTGNKVVISSSEEIIKVELVNVIGQNLTINNFKGQKIVELATDKYRQGVYLVRVEFKDGTSSIKKVLIK